MASKVRNIQLKFPHFHFEFVLCSMALAVFVTWRFQEVMAVSRLVELRQTSFRSEAVNIPVFVNPQLL